MSENATNEKNCRHGIDRSVVLCTDCDAAEGRFLERAELTKQINELPEMLRQYVHDLEADADPAGDKMRIVCLEENMAGLTDEIDRQRAEIERLTRERDEAVTGYSVRDAEVTGLLARCAQHDKEITAFCAERDRLRRRWRKSRLWKFPSASASQCLRLRLQRQWPLHPRRSPASRPLTRRQRVA